MGIIIGLIVGTLLHLYSVHSYKNILIMKAHDKSAEYINGKFYYIVPEDGLYPCDKERGK